MKKLFGYNVDNVLGLAGLERKAQFIESFLPALGLLFMGAAIGAGIGLAFAPAPGRKLRQGMSEKLDRLRDRARGTRTEEQGALNATHHS